MLNPAICSLPLKFAKLYHVWLSLRAQAAMLRKSAGSADRTFIAGPNNGINRNVCIDPTGFGSRAEPYDVLSKEDPAVLGAVLQCAPGVPASTERHSNCKCAVGTVTQCQRLLCRAAPIDRSPGSHRACAEFAGLTGQASGGSLDALWFGFSHSYRTQRRRIRTLLRLRSHRVRGE